MTRRHFGVRVPWLSVFGVGCELAKVFGAVKSDVGLRVLGRPPHWEAPALIVGQVQVQHVKLVEREKVDHALDLAHRKERAGEVERTLRCDLRPDRAP